MPKRDESTSTIHLMVAVLGVHPVALTFVQHVGERLGRLPREVLENPSVAMPLGDVRGWRTMLHVSSNQSDRALADATIVVLARSHRDDDELEIVDPDAIYFRPSSRTAPFLKAPPDAHFVVGDLQDGSGVFEAVKAAARVAMERAGRTPA